MIVGPHKGLFFAATALMCSASLYAADLSVPSIDPLTRVFTGEPNRLTVPPGFPDDVPLVSLDQDKGCTPQSADDGRIRAAVHTTSTTPEPDCLRDAPPEPTASVPIGTTPVVAPQERSIVTPAGVAGTVQSR